MYSYMEVFGFRGPDVRFSFLSHLRYALDCDGICAYFDSEDLRRGDNITGSLKEAIRNSTIAIVILSENYAASSWCLDELSEIIDSWKQGNLAVKPIFYRVEPREVRTPRRSVADALAAHELIVGKDSAKLRRWREALSEVGNLSGYHVDVTRYKHSSCFRP
ncbi:hypothetical protein MLD38_024877 [Melastoma candidum]|uniref:Uncharacterized protein n=1 Tax=Melastoma candidum TaxID=119954 RepID=A0ACB9P0G2_9MYRT|nr:hypothetical protein MLD38_024877 [Melastoma candidum]